MNPHKKALYLSHLCDGLITVAGSVAAGYAVAAATQNHWLGLAGGMAVGYLLMAFFWVVMPLLHRLAAVTQAIAVHLHDQSGGTPSDNEETDPRHLLSGVRGKSARFKMGFQATPPVVVAPLPTTEAPASSPTMWWEPRRNCSSSILRN